MKISINQRGRTHYIYKNLKDKNQAFDFYAEDISSGWVWDTYDASIYNADKKQLALVSFKARIFSKNDFQIILYRDNGRVEINPTSKITWKEWIWNFELDGNSYLFHEHRGNYRSLFKNGEQVASFSKNTLSYFDRDGFIIYSNNDEDVTLLVCLALYNDIGSYNSEDAAFTITINGGNLFGSKPPLDGKWRPLK